MSTICDGLRRDSDRGVVSDSPAHCSSCFGRCASPLLNRTRPDVWADTADIAGIQL